MFQVCLCCDAGIENDLVVDVTNSPPPPVLLLAVLVSAE